MPLPAGLMRRSSVGTGFFVSPSGATANPGTLAAPWALSYALAGSGGSIQPGDRIEMLAGTYTGDFTAANLVGSANSRIVFRNFAGQRAIIDRSVQVNTSCQYVDFRSTTSGWLEIFNSSASTTDPIGWFNFGTFCRLINVAIHDGGQSGIFQSSQGTGGTVYGCFLYNNGLNDNLDHGIYTQNSNDTKFIHENVISNNFAFGIHCYGSVPNILQGLDIRGNACFTNGAISGRSPPVVINLLLGGGTAVSRGVVRENSCFYPLAMTASGNFWMGFETAGTNNDLDCQDNWVAGGFPAARFWQWHQNSTVSGNLIATQSQVLNSQGTTSAITWSNNTHYRVATTSSWVHNASTTTFGGWRTASGVGASDTATGADPTGSWVRVRPNTFEAGRGHVIIYNWAGASTVTADISSVLSSGDIYNVYNVENLFGSAVTSGTLSGSVLTFPMSVVTPPAPLVSTPNVGVSSGPTFQVFLVRRS